jgi:lipopolysaccharide/colanic/teichoic acid biosynthesis glycosyltransferase
MAEETARQLSDIGLSEDEITHDSYRPTITEVALKHASQDAIILHPAPVEKPGAVNGSGAATEEIVVDLRSDEATIQVSSIVELASVRETAVVPDLGTLLPIRFETLPETPLQPMGGLAAATSVQQVAKRTVDITVAFVSLILLAPFMLIIVASVLLSSKGPALYRSTRVGKDGREFTFLKFRSMYDGAAADRHELDELNEQSGPVFKIEDDPRITPLGGLLRKGSIDELPQLLHVLSGKMSLVGPRPAIPGEVAEYNERTSQRLLVKPGITCIWQVSGRSTIDFDTWVDMDLEYIDTWTMRGDLNLLVRTIPAVLSGEGAY